MSTDPSQPHVFSWVIWGSATCVVFLAQVEDNAGAGAWSIGLSGMIALWIALMAYLQQGEIRATRSDWGFLVLALSSLPFWYFTADPLWAVVILTTVDALGFGPTLRKVYRFPYSEKLLFFILLGVRNVLVILALENYSLTTLLFPVVVTLACLLLISIAVYRRRVVSF
ncbi:hypothetical protein [Thiomicrorhabdus indica]|uniref:hypothetical protein n=1 Tax=Thiomicrorhabdus indica TaxID=2267253 RepID=UPI002AA84D0D|nr:hypothetical protein [Thiomicrorhabdus indica]